MKYDFEMDLDEQSSVGKIAAQIKPGSKVLEFGPGNGRLTKHLIGAKNCQVSIVELDKELFDFVSEFSQDGFYGDIESFEWANYYAGQTFDYILFADVLEHLVNPAETLKKVREFLNEDGEILITFPNLVHNSVLIHLFNNELPWASYGLLDETHNSFYTHEGFKKVFEKAGLSINIEDYLYLAVGDTELNSTYEELPEAVRYEFKMRPFGEVYQYFFSLKKHTENSHISQPQNSNYVRMVEVIQKTANKEVSQKYPFNNYTGENQTLTFPIAGDVESVIFKFADQPSFIEFSGELAGNKIDFIQSNAVIKTQNDCYLFDGEVTPQFTLFDVAGQELTIHCHYRFIGELTQTMKELLEAVKPLAQIEQRLMAQITSLKKENEQVRLTNEKLDNELQMTTDRYCKLITEEEFAIKPRNRKLRSKETAKKIQAKAISLCVDSKHWDPETKILTINGWGISNAQRQPLSYKLSVNQAPFFQALQFERPEVNEAEQLPVGTKAGFELQIRCEREKSFLIEAVAENGESWFIEI
ncbi:methyltransferase domain-containing protein [Enterococcus hirae]|uniref:class I SAM-dependent methyltransferase n=1 Tax=unclassified Enterococcus TaxID=2608891 RepID=UPI001A104394|nr:methyltransferase domain-containing protein [Enterococcus hirae]EMF0404685.1 methyltransferase domain-containing protein [Enterococcus hirae]EMF0419261.1 methyltransferase domain-containing protein [Enterococcus hirae]EMF0513341.1 methyltransferase domain-containing protein [Enterococcus hirae]